MVGRMTSQDYEAFVSQKLTRQPPTGLSTVPALHDGLFPFRGDPRCAVALRIAEQANRVFR